MPTGENIATQGSVGHSFVVLLDGFAMSMRVETIVDELRPEYPASRRLLRRDLTVGRSASGRFPVGTAGADQARRSGPGGAEASSWIVAISRWPSLKGRTSGIQASPCSTERSRSRKKSVCTNGRMRVKRSSGMIAPIGGSLKPELVLLGSVRAYSWFCSYYLGCCVLLRLTHGPLTALPASILLMFVFVVGPVGAIIAITTSR